MGTQLINYLVLGVISGAPIFAHHGTSVDVPDGQDDHFDRNSN